MAVRLTQKQMLRIENDNELIHRIALADVILARTPLAAQDECLWQRPLNEIEARGAPYTLEVLAFMVQSKKDLQFLAATINRLKKGD